MRYAHGMKPGPLLLTVGLPVLLAVATIGTQEAAGQEPRRCLALSSIDRTEVIDDRTIAFYLIDGRVYLNRLDRACRNLDRNRPFSYATSTGQLCAIDVINVIEDLGALSNFGDTCGLGEFSPTDEEEIEALLGERELVEVEPEEVEVEEGDGDVEGEGEGEGESDREVTEVESAEADE